MAVSGNPVHDVMSRGAISGDQKLTLRSLAGRALTTLAGAQFDSGGCGAGPPSSVDVDERTRDGL